MKILILKLRKASEKTEKMAITVIEFITFATRTKRFIDAVNLVNANVGAFVVSAIEVVKSKLKGSATNIITKRNHFEGYYRQVEGKYKIRVF